jgi:hypothetical protein
MSTIFIIHGVEGHPGENWFPWLKSELEKLGHKVIVPQFPTPEGQTLDNWLATLKNYEADLTPETILIGHSLGGCFILNILEHTRVKAAYLVAPVFGILGNSFDKGMKTFAQHEFNWPTILKNCPHFEIFHSDNDPYIKLEKAQDLGRHLNTPVTLIPSGGHFNQSAGFTKFEKLLEKIKN